MKYLIIVLFSLGVCSGINSQEDSETFNRKGRILIETGYNLIAGFSSGTGLSYILDSDENTITSLGFDGGYFVSDNFALKAKFSLLSSGGSLTNFSVGGKYYIGGNVPLELGAGILSGGNASEFLGNISIGYAINIAENIALEPNLGALISNGSILEFGLTFAMFL